MGIGIEIQVFVRMHPTVIAMAPIDKLILVLPRFYNNAMLFTCLLRSVASATQLHAVFFTVTR